MFEPHYHLKNQVIDLSGPEGNYHFLTAIVYRWIKDIEGREGLENFQKQIEVLKSLRGGKLSYEEYVEIYKTKTGATFVPNFDEEELYI